MEFYFKFCLFILFFLHFNERGFAFTKNGKEQRGGENNLQLSNTTNAEVLPHYLKMAMEDSMIFLFLLNVENQLEVHVINSTLSNDSCQIEGLESTPDVISTAVIYDKEKYILAIGYRKHIQLMAVQIKQIDSAKRYCGRAEKLQKLEFDNDVRNILTFKAHVADHETSHMIVSLESPIGNNKIVLLRWINFGFHETEEVIFESVIKVSVLTLKTCRGALILLTKSHSSLKKTDSIWVYQIDSLGKLGLKQHLYMNYTLFEPFMLNCDHYNFLVCNKSKNVNSCSVFTSLAKHIEFFEERRIRIDGNPRLAYAKNIVVMWNFRGQSKMHAFFDHRLTNPMPINANNRIMKDVGEMYVRKATDNKFVIVYIDPKIFIVEARHLNLTIENQNLLAGPADSFENITKRIFRRIYSRKILLDKIATLANQTGNAIEYLNLNRTCIENGIVKKVNVSNKAISLPSGMHEHVVRLGQEAQKNLIRVLNIEKHSTIKKLRVKNLIYNGSLYFDHNSKDSNRLILNSSKVVVLKEVHTGRLITWQKPKVASTHRFRDDYSPIVKIFQNIKVQKVMLQQINDINYPKLYADIFLRNRDSDINGSLVFRSKKTAESVYCQDLSAKTLNQQSINDFFTLKNDQKIKSNILVSKFLVSNISVSSVNGMNIGEIALVGTNNILKSPILIHNFTIAGDLALSSTNEADFADHLRTVKKLNSFSQIYNEEVRIKGRLILQNLFTATRAQKYFPRYRDLASHLIRLADLSQMFWMKRISQNIYTPVQFAIPVEFGWLETEFLNDKMVANYLLRSGNLRLLSSFSMQSMIITGHFNSEIDFTRANDDLISIEQLNANLIRQNFESVEMLGRKNFSRVLKTTRLFSRNVNSILNEDLVRMSLVHDWIHLIGSKRMNNLIVKDKFTVALRMDVELFNMQNMSKFFNLAVQKESISLKTLQFMNTVKMVNVSVDSMNRLSIPGNDFHSLSPLRTILIKSDVVFLRNLSVKKLNSIIWNEFFANLKLKTDEVLQVGGIKSFLKRVDINKALNFDAVNNINQVKMFHNTLRRSGSQTISRLWKFHYFNVNNLTSAGRIDGIEATHLLGSNSNTKIVGRLKIMSVRLQGNLLGLIDSESTVTRSMHNLRHINSANWSEIHIRYHAEWQNEQKGPMSKFQLIRNYAMQSVTSQTIQGTVRFKFPPKFMIALLSHHLGGVDLGSIAVDYLGRNSNSLHVAVISGLKYFETSLEIRASIPLAKVVDVEVINHVDILSLNQSLVRRLPSEFHQIFGKKIFSVHLTVKNLMVEGLVNTVLPTHLVFMNKTYLIEAPLVQFAHSKITMHTTSIGRINQIELNAFVDKRVRIKGDRQIINGSLTFDRLWTNNAVFSYINRCALKRVVLKKFNHHQIVNGPKTFLKPLNIIGPSSMVTANGIDLIDKYNTSMFSNQYHKLKRVEIFGDGETIFQQGLYISGDHYVDIVSELRTNNRNLKMLLKVAQARVSKKQIVTNHSRRFLYLEYEKNPRNYLNVSLADDYPSVRNSCTNRCKMPSFDRKRMRTISSIPSDYHKLQVYVENNCCKNSSSFEISFNQRRMSFNYSRPIDHLWTFTAGQPNRIYVMVELAKGPNNKTVILLRVDSLSMNASSVQEIILSDTGPPIISSQLYETSSGLFFFPGIDKLRVFQFDSNLESFKESFRRELRWNRGSIVPIDAADTLYQTIVANRGDRKLFVYNGNSSATNQILYVPRPLESFVTFHDSQTGENALAIFSLDSSFYLYLYYSSVEGWIYETQGLCSNTTGVVLRQTDFGSSLQLMDLLIATEPEELSLPPFSMRYFAQKSGRWP